jgi:hypothetical protein
VEREDAGKYEKDGEVKNVEVYLTGGIPVQKRFASA